MNTFKVLNPRLYLILILLLGGGLGLFNTQPVQAVPEYLNIADNTTMQRWGYAGINQLPNGNIIAFIGTDDTGTIRGWQTWQTISADGGYTWGKPSLIYSSNETVTKGIPATVVSENTIYALYNWWFDSEHSELHMIESKDNAQTWGNDRQIPVKGSYASAIQNGIVTQNGTLIFPIQYTLTKDEYYIASLIISDGADWYQGGEILMDSEAGNGTVEPSIVELSDGTLLCMTRNNQGQLYYSKSYDGGLNWDNARQSDFGAPDSPCVLRRVSPDTILLAWNSDNSTYYKRYPLKITMSTDDGQTWSAPATVAQTDYNVDYPDILPLVDGSCIIKWRDSPGGDGQAGETSKALKFTLDDLNSSPWYSRTITPPAPPPVQISGSGGGGGGSAVSGNKRITAVGDMVNRYMVLWADDIEALSDDNKLEIFIPIGTEIKNEKGNKINSIVVNRLETSDYSGNVSAVYEVGPDKVSLSPTVSLTIKNKGIDGQDLILCRYVDGKWLMLDNNALDDKKVSADIDTFGTFAITRRMPIGELKEYWEPLKGIFEF